MRPSIAITTMSCLAFLLTLTTGCGNVLRQVVPELVNVERPEPDPILKHGCPPPPPMPPRASLPARDVRPLVAEMAKQVDRGDQCAIVVEGWKAWDLCMRARAKKSDAACPDLDAILRRLGPPPMVPPLS